jgi:ketosteroid isomerase-like protein
MSPRTSVLVIGVVAGLLSTGRAASLDPIDTLVQTEREFAQAAAAKGWRDAFLDYFADDAIVLGTEVVLAKPGLRARPSQPASEVSLTWEPRAGDLASSGELGWLTGPSTFIDHTDANGQPRYGNYLTIWKRGTDGRWRVFIDIGTSTPAPVTFADGFVRARMPSRYAGSGDRSATASLLDADRRLNDAIARDDGAIAAYGGVLSPDARLHRNGSGTVPAVGPAAIAAWLTAHPTDDRFTTTAGETSAAGDLGYVYGTYLPAGGSIRGGYLRVWARTADGRWLLEADAIVPPAASR